MRFSLCLYSRPLSRLGLGLLVLGFAGCLSPEEQVRDADEEVYPLIDVRRDELFGHPGGFTIDPPEDSLRQRILRGEWDPEREFSLVDCLVIAAENSRDLQARRENLYRSALDLTLERWRFSNRPFAAFVGSASGTGDDSASATVDGSAGFSRLLGTGATIVTSLGSNLFRIVSSGDKWSAISDLSMSITQPLMRGAGQAIATEPLTQAERDLVYAVRSYERFRRTYAVDVASRVYFLLQAIDELGNEERNYADLVTLRERNEALAAAGRLSDIQSDQALQEELLSENRLIALRAGLARQRDQFNLFLGLPINVTLKLDPAEFDSLSEDDPWLERIDELSAPDQAIAHRLDHLTIADALEDSRRRVTIAEDALRAGLNLSVSGAAPIVGEAQPQDFRFQDTDWSGSLSLDLPLDRKSERNALRASHISLAAAQRAVTESEDIIRANVRDAFRNVRDARASYLIQRNAVTLAKGRVESAQLKLAAGRAETRDLLDAQRDMVGAENDATGALIRFTLARLDLYLELEALDMDESGIQVAYTRLEEWSKPNELD